MKVSKRLGRYVKRIPATVSEPKPEPIRAVSPKEMKPATKPAYSWTPGYKTGDYVFSMRSKKEYWLTSKELQEYDAALNRIEDDEAFEDWFEEWLKAHPYVKPKDYYQSKPYDWGKTGGGKGLSSWWRSDLYTSWGGAWGTGTDERRLAEVMQVVASTIKIVDDNDPPSVVQWAAKDATSSTNLNANIISISPEAALDKSLTIEDAIDISTSHALHEAGHDNPEYGTRTIVHQLEKPDRLKPLAVVATLANIIEDNRTERITGKEKYPGFDPYFPKGKADLWKRRKAEFNPEKWGDIYECLNALIIHLRWPEHSPEILSDPSFTAELPWWEEWERKYQGGEVGFRQTIIDGLDRLANDEERKKEMEQIADGEKADDLARRKLEEALDRALERVADKVAQSCWSETEYDKKLSSEVAERVKKLVKEKLHQSAILTECGSTKPKLWVRKPIEYPSSIKAYTGKPSPLVDRYKAALQFRPELPRFSTRLLKSGDIDEEELWRWGIQDYRVFERQNIETYPKAIVGLLVDMSGSMEHSIRWENDYKTKVWVAQQLTQLFVLALRDMEGIRPYVYGHTGDLNLNATETSAADFMYIWEPGDPLTRIGLITAEDHGNNYDGFAIDWAVDQLLANRIEQDESVILIVLSDGYPAGHNYGDEMAMQHVHRVVDGAEKRGVPILQVAIDHALRPAAQGKMYRYWVPFRSASELPRQMATELSRMLNTKYVGG